MKRPSKFWHLRIWRFSIALLLLPFAASGAYGAAPTSHAECVAHAHAHCHAQHAGDFQKFADCLTNLLNYCDGIHDPGTPPGHASGDLTTDGGRMARYLAELLGSAALALETRPVDAAGGDVLYGPVTLGRGDTLAASASSVDRSRECSGLVDVTFFEHDLTASSDQSGLPADPTMEAISRSELGSTTLGVGEATHVEVHGDDPPRTVMLQVRLEFEAADDSEFPCVGIGGTVLRADGTVETLDGGVFSDKP